MWIPVFKVGTWTDSSGNTRTWTEEDLDLIVQKNNEVLGESHDVPLVIGHPKDNSPAYGWTEKLKREGEILYAKIKPTVAEFVDWLRSKIYNKVSISLYEDGLLRHIGFLGGVPPAVKGLKMPEFSRQEYSEFEQEVVIFEEKKQNYPEEDMSDKEKLKELEQRIAQLQKENETLRSNFQEVDEERQKVLQELQRINLEKKKLEFQQFLNEEIAFGALTEQQKEKAMQILASLSSVNFSENSNENADLVNEFKEFLKSFPAKVQPGEFATKTRAPKKIDNVDEIRKQKVQEYMDTYKVDYKQALIAVSKEHPELFADREV